MFAGQPARLFVRCLWAPVVVLSLACRDSEGPLEPAASHDLQGLEPSLSATAIPSQYIVVSAPIG